VATRADKQDNSCLKASPLIDDRLTVSTSVDRRPQLRAPSVDRPTHSMQSLISRSALLALAVVLVLHAVIGDRTAESERHGFTGDLGNNNPAYHLIDDDGSLDTAMINYLFARQMIKRLQASADITDLQRKRTYWRQCAFNAVSCFGGKK